MHVDDVEDLAILTCPNLNHTILLETSALVHKNRFELYQSHPAIPYLNYFTRFWIVNYIVLSQQIV
jgi:hypothetical protein